jgi:PAS domain S-box-containing protein
MRISEMVVQALLASRADAIIAADRSGKIIFWNAGAERIFGHSSAGAVGEPLDIIIPERLRQRHWEGNRLAMDAGRSRYDDGDVLAVPGIRKDGSPISLEFTIAFLRDECRQVVGVAAVVRDVTQRFDEMKALRRKLANTIA